MTRRRSIFATSLALALFAGCHSAPKPQPDGSPTLALPASDAGPECRADADCALTRIPEGSCCASLCTPRAISRAALAAQARAAPRCTEACVHPLCRPESADLVPACVEGRCQVRHTRHARD